MPQCNPTTASDFWAEDGEHTNRPIALPQGQTAMVITEGCGVAAPDPVNVSLSVLAA